MFKSKKGFTLVELLAVIVILAIILAIAIPSITTLINNSKKGAFESNVKMLAAGIEYKILEKSQGAAGTDFVAATKPYTLTSGDIVSIGGVSSDYTSVVLTNTSPVTITVTGVSTGRFGAYTVTGGTRNSATAN